MKATVSIADDLFRRADEAACTSGLNRSAFYAAALDAYLQAIADDGVTRDIDAALEDSDDDDLSAWTDAAARHTFDHLP